MLPIAELIVFRPTQGVEHEGTFIDYDCHRFDAQRRRVRAIAERAAEKQLAASGAKSDQFEFFGNAVSTLFAEFDAVCPENPVSAFRDIPTTNDDEPIGPGHRQQ